MDDSEELYQRYVALANVNAEMLSRMSKNYGPEELAHLVRATGVIPEDEVLAVATALMDAGYENSATLADMDAAELRRELQEQGQALKMPVIRTLVRNIKLDAHVLGYMEIRASIADTAVSLSRGRSLGLDTPRRGASETMESSAARPAGQCTCCMCGG